ncbi:MAG: hypothetical protein JWM68_5730 [Verrucomicrobiales bacterium]|nr:hypothetical protein [Verrucomicrobiales bacterium]
MNSAYLADMERFAFLVFTRQKQCAPILEEIHRLLLLPLCDADRKRLNTIRRWLLCPYTLWVVDCKGLAEKMCRDLLEMKQLSDDIAAVLQRLEDLPSEETQALIGKNERSVKAGVYEDFLTDTAQGKFNAREKELFQSPEFKADLADLRRRFDVELYYLPGRLLRRTLTGERNMRPEGFINNWETEKERFQGALDTICARHHLYGILETTPLLLKLSVNPTAHGLMIFIPAYWSLDYKRDLNWPKIQELQNLRCERATEIEFSAKIRRVALALIKWNGLKNRTMNKIPFICQEIGASPDTDESTVRRWMRHAGKLV